LKTQQSEVVYQGGDSLHNQQKIYRDEEEGEIKRCSRLVITKVVPADHQAGTSRKSQSQNGSI
jgi:hypothetical protein